MPQLQSHPGAGFSREYVCPGEATPFRRTSAICTTLIQLCANGSRFRMTAFGLDCEPGKKKTLAVLRQGRKDMEAGDHPRFPSNNSGAGTAMISGRLTAEEMRSLPSRRTLHLHGRQRQDHFPRASGATVPTAYISILLVLILATIRDYPDGF